ncbi:mannosyltransferase [Antarcticibacterium flavum]|uniref:Mannosyltransferase n=1 Tax=Antarcticibacterium flavum TaxID=2058175 RepID=A0A5B7X581_9FLAO|nr:MULTISPECIES: mannosyltransferase [Antarcticibacterium]MCM4159506.1 mannosyltransferase [Antarcticibacterium sp. W02-3]QCY69862.1 mannosyltransferase [Antarcticibacterium flavum]
MGRFLQFNKMPLLLLFTGVLLYSSFAYDLVREDFIKLVTLYAGLFFLSWKLVQLKKTDFWFLATAALLFRLIFIVSLPNLSQDFYRFIWDGRMLVAGWNPYLYLPEDLVATGTGPVEQASELYTGMGELNGSHYTNYPPLNQLIFALAGIFAGKSILGSVIIMRLVIIAADVGILYFGKKLLEHFKLPAYQIFWFVLNPLVIIELTGNLHFEGVMLFFLLASLYFLLKNRWILSGVLLALSVLLKLLPLIFLPLLFNFFRKKLNPSEKALGLGKMLLYYSVVALVIVVGFLPFLSMDTVSNFAASIGLWFQKFEFNASIYYVVRWIGFQVKGYNIIATAGKVLPLVFILLLLVLSFFRRNRSLQQLISTMLLAVIAYFLLATTVHPWYVLTPLLLSVFTRYKFALLWSFLVILSYYAYSNPAYEESYWLIAVEYLAVIGVFGYELFKEWREHRNTERSPAEV